MNRNIRMLMWAVSLAQILFALGFIVQVPFLTRLWPLQGTTPLSYTFIASIFAAAAASTIWALYMREDAALAGIALDYIAILTPVVVLMIQLGGDSAIVFALVSAVTVVLAIMLFRMTWKIPARDKRPTPRLVYWSFAAFVVALIIVGGGLILKTPGIMPWNLAPEPWQGVIFGWMFIGAAAYFTYALYRPGWFNAGGQLAGFLLYDLVLIVPFLQRLPTIDPALRNNLIVYLIVIVYSGALAIYYLFINPGTRVVSARA